MFRTLRFYHSFFKFLSTPSARRATVYIIYTVREVQISIHALREEGDSGHKIFLPSPVTFLSTPSARRATMGSKTQFYRAY